MKANQKIHKALLALAAVIILFLILISIRFIVGGDEDTWICQNGQWIKHGNPSAEKPTISCDERNEEKVFLSLPFKKNPTMLIPMGETLEHPKPDNPLGHPGIDFLWFDERGGVLTEIYSSLDGEIAAVWDSEGKQDITVKSGRWTIQYGHITNLPKNIKERNHVNIGDKIGEAENMHWSFGYTQKFEPKYPDYLCPLSYFSRENQELLNSIEIMSKHKEAGFDTICSGDYKE